MTSRILFIIILKVIGLLALKDILVGLFGALPALGYAFQEAGSVEGVIYLLVLVGSVALYCLLPYAFIFKPAWLADKLQLSSGIEQEAIPLAVHRSTILSVAIIVVGGLLLVNELPNFLRLLLAYSQERRGGVIDPELTNLVQTATKIALGALLISKQRQLVNFIEYQRRRQPA
ncbi:hypothetical protein [Hymenobacter weizhouensis]|uniref:hypothetical protein n=1 Tax=Hymenobacter sp. YIM 151500-1 TaxID=2987689 RepID=UPI002226A4EC|nr:hypothetical protein [Hymenobacter sp. YIM 151500-1]UYZ63509.1 hypothetical protein OIS53_01390 [Hymenobacter sp. YIM 151500-1]